MFSCLGVLVVYLSHLELPWLPVAVIFDRFQEELTQQGYAIGYAAWKGKKTQQTIWHSTNRRVGLVRPGKEQEGLFNPERKLHWLGSDACTSSGSKEDWKVS